jgi:hypothetical protein
MDFSGASASVSDSEPGSPERTRTEVYFGGIDYAPQSFGEQIFWLPSRFYAQNSNNSARMVAIYSDCPSQCGK